MVAPAIVAAGIGAASTLGSAIMGNKAKRDSERRQTARMNQIMAELDAGGMPELNEYELEAFKNLFTAQEMGPSAYENIQLDPEALDAQRAALSKLGEIDQGGLLLGDKVALQEIQDSLAQEDAGRQAAIQQNMAERGMGGGGAELAQRLMSQQASADRAGANSRNVAAMAQQRALDAIMQRGQLGGQMRMQQYGMEADKARAMDEISRFNAGQRQQAQVVNQDTANMNTRLAHQQATMKNQLEQQRYDNALNKAGVKSGAYQGQNAIDAAGAANQANMYGSIGSAIGQIAGAYAQNNTKK